MPVKIRLMRIGARKRPFYRVVAVDERKKRTGGYLELLGTYNPISEPKEIKLDQAKIDAWVKKGAVPSDGFLRIIGKAPQRPPRKPKKEPKEAPKPAEAPVAEASPKVEEPTEVTENTPEEAVSEGTSENKTDSAPAEAPAEEAPADNQPPEASEAQAEDTKPGEAENSTEETKE